MEWKRSWKKLDGARARALRTQPRACECSLRVKSRGVGEVWLEICKAIGFTLLQACFLPEFFVSGTTFLDLSTMSEGYADSFVAFSNDLRWSIYADSRSFLRIGPSPRQSPSQSKIPSLNRPKSQQKGDNPRYPSMKRSAAASAPTTKSPHKPSDNSNRHRHQHRIVPPNGDPIFRVEKKTGSADSGFSADCWAHSRKARLRRRRNGALISRRGSRIS